MKRGFCIKCGSGRLIFGVLGTTAQIYECKDCGYRGPIIIENGELAEELRKIYEEKKKEQS
ncbi:MAG: hypothetical protein ACE5K4_05830 [Candidatus Hydrothermarchaeota archaeon]